RPLPEGVAGRDALRGRARGQRRRRTLAAIAAPTPDPRAGCLGGGAASGARARARAARQRGHPQEPLPIHGDPRRPPDLVAGAVAVLVLGHVPAARPATRAVDG